MTEYDDFLDTLQHLYNFDNAEQFFNTLSVIANLMVELNNDYLRGAELRRTFQHDRLTITVQFNKKAK